MILRSSRPIPSSPRLEQPLGALVADDSADRPASTGPWIGWRNQEKQEVYHVREPVSPIIAG
jgi:hypothetical protein